MKGATFPPDRRIRAAMALADVDYPELAARIKRKGMAERTLRKWGNKEATPQTHHLRYIAAACGVSPAFFSVDLTAIDGEAGSELSDLRSRLERVETLLKKARLEEIASDLAALRRGAGGHRGGAGPQ